jgi:hypothetical protein
MSFATLQEAWGVTTFVPETRLSPALMTNRKPIETRRGYKETEDDAHGHMRLPPGKSPRDTVRRYLDAVYQERGARGVARVLGRDLVRQICSVDRPSVMSWLSNEENLLIVLVVAFVLLLITDLLK